MPGPKSWDFTGRQTGAGRGKSSPALSSAPASRGKAGTQTPAVVICYSHALGLHRRRVCCTVPLRKETRVLTAAHQRVQLPELLSFVAFGMNLTLIAESSPLFCEAAPAKPSCCASRAQPSAGTGACRTQRSDLFPPAGCVSYQDSPAEALWLCRALSGLAVRGGGSRSRLISAGCRPGRCCPRPLCAPGRAQPPSLGRCERLSEAGVLWLKVIGLGTPSLLSRNEHGNGPHVGASGERLLSCRPVKIAFWQGS